MKRYYTKRDEFAHKGQWVVHWHVMYRGPNGDRSMQIYATKKLADEARDWWNDERSAEKRTMPLFPDGDRQRITHTKPKEGT